MPPRLKIGMRKEHQKADIGHKSDLTAIARANYAERRRRDDAAGVDRDLFGEPGWDMLLYLYIQHCDGHPVLTGKLCVASCVPATTALRWIGKLVENGLADRKADQADLRRLHVCLTGDGVHRVEAILRAM